MLQEKVLFALPLGRRGSERDMASEALLLPFVLPLASTQLAKHHAAVLGKTWF